MRYPLLVDLTTLKDGVEMQKWKVIHDGPASKSPSGLKFHGAFSI